MMSLLRREIICPLLASRRGMAYRRLLPVLRRQLREVADPARRAAWQVRHVGELLRQADGHSEFHRERFRLAGFTPADFRSLDDLRRLPVMTKEQVVAHRQAILVDNIPAERLVETATGGTTGSSCRFWRDDRCHAMRMAMRVLADELLGWRPGDPSALIWNAYQDLSGEHQGLKQRLVNWAGWRTLEIDASRLDDATIARWVDRMRNQAVEVVYGYARSIRDIAEYMEAAGESLPAVRLVVTTAEPLYQHDRALIERVFRCRVCDRYASREHGPMAQQDDRGDLRVFGNSIIVEVDAEPGAPGDILVTDLWNRAFPFIRYRIGDTAFMRPLDGDASGLPVMGALTGRQTDTLLALDGSRVSGMSFHETFVDEETHLCGRDSIGQIQFLQRARDHVHVRVVAGTGYESGTEERRLVRIVQSILGAGMKVTFEYVDVIPRSASGKYRFTVNEMPRG